jgi:hypothetical protein
MPAENELSCTTECCSRGLYFHHDLPILIPINGFLQTTPKKSSIGLESGALCYERRL